MDETYNVEVWMGEEHRAFPYDRWRDESPELDSFKSDRNTVFFNASLLVEFGDQETKDAYQVEREQFIETCRRKTTRLDVWDYSVFSNDLAEAKGVMVSGSRERWLSFACYAPLVFLGLGWPYRVFFDRTVGFVRFNARKLIYRKLEPSSIPTGGLSVESDNNHGNDKIPQRMGAPKTTYSAPARSLDQRDLSKAQTESAIKELIRATTSGVRSVDELEREFRRRTMNRTTRATPSSEESKSNTGDGYTTTVNFILVSIVAVCFFAAILLIPVLFDLLLH